MALPFVAPVAGLPWLLAKLLGLANFVLYRVAAWTGTLALYRKGRRHRRLRWMYYGAAAVLYVLSWAVIVIGTEKIWHWAAARLAR